MSKYKKDNRESSVYSRSQTDSTINTFSSPSSTQTNFHTSSGHSQSTAASLQSCGGSSASSGTGSPMTSSKIVKTVKQMGGKTRDILKRWQTMNNGQMSEDSMIGPDDIADMYTSSENSSLYQVKPKKGTWSVHVWSK